MKKLFQLAMPKIDVNQLNSRFKKFKPRHAYEARNARGNKKKARRAKLKPPAVDDERSSPARATGY